MHFKATILFTIFLTLSLGCSSSDSGSQQNSPLEVVSSKRYGTGHLVNFSSSSLTSDGGQIFLATSYTYPENGPSTDSNFWVVKLDGAGDIQWQRNYGGSHYEQAEKIIQTNDGGYVFYGTTRSIDGDVQGNTDDFNNSSWLVKIDALGNIQWQKTAVCFSNTPLDIIQTQDGGFLAVSYQTLRKLDLLGNTVWDVPVSFYAVSLLETNGGFIVAGNQYHDSSQTGWDYYTARIAKIGIDGSTLWEKEYTQGYINKTAKTDDAGFIILGYTANPSVPNIHTTSFGASTDCWVAKLNSVGDLAWQKAFGGSSQDIAYDIVVSSDGYIIGSSSESKNGDLTGTYHYGDYWLFKTDLTGNLIWQKNFGGNQTDDLKCVHRQSDGTIIMTGKSASNTNDLSNIPRIGEEDIWILKVREQ